MDFSAFGSTLPFDLSRPTKDPLGNFSGVFLNEKGRRKVWKKEGEAQSTSAAWGEAVHSMVQSEMALKGSLAMAEMPLLDVKNNMLSKVDAFTKNKEAIEIKTVGLAELLAMRAPRVEHKMQLIYYLKALGAAGNDIKGIILYVAREAPGIRKSFEVDVEGNVTLLGAAATAFMRQKRGGTSREKMLRSLEVSMEETVTNEELAANYADYAAEARKFRRRDLAQKRKAEFRRAYDLAHSSRSQEELLNLDGMPHGGIAQSLRRYFTGFGSGFRRRKGEKTIGLNLSKALAEKHVSNVPPVLLPPNKKIRVETPLELASKKFKRSKPSFQDNLRRWRFKQRKGERLLRDVKNKKKKLIEKIRFAKQKKDDINNSIRLVKEKQVKKKKEFRSKLAPTRARLAERRGAVGAKFRALQEEVLRKNKRFPYKDPRRELLKELHKNKANDLVEHLLSTKSKELEEIVSLMDKKRASSPGLFDDFRKKEVAKELLGVTAHDELSLWHRFRKDVVASHKKGAAPRKQSSSSPKVSDAQLEFDLSSSEPAPKAAPKKAKTPRKNLIIPSPNTGAGLKPPSIEPPIKKEIFFDIENTIARKEVGATGYVLQYGARVLEGENTTAALKGKALSREQMQAEIKKRIAGGKAFYAHSALLDVQTAEFALDLLEKQGTGGLVSSGVLSKDSLPKIKAMAQRAGFGGKPSSAMQYLQRTLSEYIAGTTEVVDGERKFKEAYAKQSKFIPTVERIDEWFDAEERMLRKVRSFQRSFAKDGKSAQFIGHNIVSHDNPIIKEASRIHGIEPVDISSRHSVLDTLHTNSSFQESLMEGVEAYEKKHLAPGRVMKSKIEVGGAQKTIKALEPIGKIAGLSTDETRKKYQHTSALHDVDQSIATKIAVENAPLEQRVKYVENFMNLSEGKGGAIKQAPLLSESEIVSKEVVDIVENGKTSIGVKGASPSPPPKSPNPMKSVISKVTEIFPEMKPVVADIGEMSKGAKKIVEAGISEVAPIANLASDAFDAASDAVRSYVTKEPPRKIHNLTKTWKGAGILAVGAGIGMLGISSLFSQGSYSPRPLEVTAKPMYQNVSNGEHIQKQSEGGIERERMRGMLTDFGSPYQGRVGSMLGLLRTHFLSRRNLSKTGRFLNRNPYVPSSKAIPEAIVSSSVRDAPLAMLGSAATSKVARTPSVGVDDYKVIEKREKYKRQQKFRTVSSIGTRQIFTLDRNKIGHYVM